MVPGGFEVIRREPVGGRALALVSDLTRFDPPEFGSPEPDDGVASCYEALGEDAWPHVLIRGVAG